VNLEAPGPVRRGSRFLLRIVPVMAMVLVTSATSECAGGVGLACTDMGCSDGLGVRVTHDLPGHATVRVAAAGEERTFTCDPAFACLGFFEEWSPAEVDVEVVWEGGAFSTRATPEYKLVYPNGRRCGPECRQGTVGVSLP
jgi:hypothetical protein